MPSHWKQTSFFELYMDFWFWFFSSVHVSKDYADFNARWQKRRIFCNVISKSSKSMGAYSTSVLIQNMFKVSHSQMRSRPGSIGHWELGLIDDWDDDICGKLVSSVRDIFLKFENETSNTASERGAVNDSVEELAVALLHHLVKMVTRKLFWFLSLTESF